MSARDDDRTTSYCGTCGMTHADAPCTLRPLDGESTRATILAALRLFQNNTAHGPTMDSLAGHFADAPALTIQEIDLLCEEFNSSGIIMLDVDECPEHGPHAQDYCPACKEREAAAQWRGAAIALAVSCQDDVFTDCDSHAGRVESITQQARNILEMEG